MLNLEWLRTFKVIYEAGSLSAAAQVLFISQPGVSLHLNSLEAYTGYRLFDRDTRNMLPTDKGTMLYHYVIDSIGRLEEAEQMFQRRSKIEKPTISVGMYFETFQHTLEAHVAQLPFNLIAHFGDSPQIVQELQNGTLDLILTPHKNQQNNLEFTPFSQERLILVCGSNTPVEKLEELAIISNKSKIMDWLGKQTWYTTADMDPLKKFWHKSFDKMPGFKPNFVLPYFSSILRCLRNGCGFAVIPDFLCRKDLCEETIRIAWEDDKPLEQVLYFGKRKNAYYAGELKQLEELLIKNWVSGKPNYA
ncbi:LysR family transcriptional regulator [Mucilaginibacter sp. UR6-1]|uniref:LysR family transcriptional regulator n=1 Tax=Mucilaginibacter sp. UR6-1 TaxID=1435643 RepID=UPI001E4FA9D3|nr:LysR family transcriptional regulator [Mucilaginibacter sp. UR6-1]MCC8408549.1 LysR family transcriptional regulator [Mucilaginibacter sp. UR6-1]